MSRYDEIRAGGSFVFQKVTNHTTFPLKRGLDSNKSLGNKGVKQFGKVVRKQLEDVGHKETFPTRLAFDTRGVAIEKIKESRHTGSNLVLGNIIISISMGITILLDEGSKRADFSPHQIRKMTPKRLLFLDYSL